MKLVLSKSNVKQQIMTDIHCISAFPPSDIYELRGLWLFCLSPLVFLFSKTFRVFGFQIFCL